MKGLFIKDFSTVWKIILSSIGITYLTMIIFNLIFHTTEDRNALLAIDLAILMLIGIVLNVILLADDKTSKFTEYTKVLPISRKAVIAESFIFSFGVIVVYIIACILLLLIIGKKGDTSNIWWIIFIMFPLSLVLTGILNSIIILFNNKLPLLVSLVMSPIILAFVIVYIDNQSEYDSFIYKNKMLILLMSIGIYIISYIYTVVIDKQKERITNVLFYARYALITTGVALAVIGIIYVAYLTDIYKYKIDKAYKNGVNKTYYLKVELEKYDDIKSYKKAMTKRNKFYKEISKIKGVDGVGEYSIYAMDKNFNLANKISKIQKNHKYCTYNHTKDNDVIECIDMTAETFDLFDISIKEGIKPTKLDKYYDEDAVFVYLGSAYADVEGLGVGDSYKYKDTGRKYIIAGIIDTDNNSKIVDPFIMETEQDMARPTSVLKYAVICVDTSYLAEYAYFGITSSDKEEDIHKEIKKLAKKYKYSCKIGSMKDVVNETYEETTVDKFINFIISPFK